MRIRSIRWAGVCFALLAAVTWAQLVRGFISGTLQDESGSVIVGAAVQITNAATGGRSAAITNESGAYRFVAVEPGTYTVVYRKDGFDALRVEAVTVGAAQEVVLNQTMKVGATATTVEVKAEAAAVELSKSSATLSRKLDESIVENMPLTGATRDVNTLALLAPTVTRAPGSTEIAANGQRARNNNFILDGVDNNDLSVTLSSSRVVTEAIAEFQVQTSPYSVEYGRNSGAQISIITKGGSNALHGEAWDYYRGNWMEPVSLLNKRAGLNKTPRFVHNQAGGALGGPIIKNRLFYFGLVETNRRREAADARNATSATIPTPDGFAALSSLPLGPGQTPQSRQASLGALEFLPSVYQQVGNTFENVRTTTVNGVAVPVGTVTIPLANPSDFWNVVGRTDFLATQKDSISYRFLLDKRNQPDVVSNLQFGNLFSGAQTILSQNHFLSWTRPVSSHFVNEARFAYVRRNLNFPENDPATSTSIITGFFTIGGASNFPQARVSNTFQWQDVATYMFGRHSLKFGMDLRRNRLFNLAAFDTKGTWRFNNLADFVNNNAFSLSQAINQATFDARQTNQNYFVQDDIKLTRNLTINLGVRYEFSDTPFGFFGASSDQVANALVPRNVRSDRNNWAPRLGLAWSPSPKDGLLHALLGDGRTVFRGGYGVGYDVLFYNILTVNASNYPRVVVQDTLQPNTLNLFPTLAPRQNVAPVFDPLATFVNTPTDAQNPTTHFYSFSIQRQLGSSYVVEVGYSGNRSYHGIRQGQANPGILTEAQAATVRASGSASSIPGVQARRLFPQFGSRVTIETTAMSNYNAMFLRFDKRFSHGLALGANFTWSKLMSDNDESLGVGDITNSSPQVPQDFLNYRSEWSRSVFDRPGRFSVYYNYQIPWFSHGALGGRAGRYAFGGWSLTGFTEWQSGQPFTIRTGVDSGGIGTTAPARPDYNPGGVLIKDPVSGDLRTFTIPTNGTGIVVTALNASGSPLANTRPGGGNLGRNTFRGPGFTNWNFSLAKTFGLTERINLGVRADWINMWNHRNFGNPVATMSSPAFGTNIATGAATDPGGRTMLFSGRVRF
jgi:outer membrane receptor protein involved in Fe transport